MASWKSKFDAANNRLDLYLGFPKGSTECGQAECKPHYTEEKTWKHLDFFQHKAYLHARVPRVKCPENCKSSMGSPKIGVHIDVKRMPLAGGMPVGPITQLVKEHDPNLEDNSSLC